MSHCLLFHYSKDKASAELPKSRGKRLNYGFATEGVGAGSCNADVEVPAFEGGTVFGRAWHDSVSEADRFVLRVFAEPALDGFVVAVDHDFIDAADVRGIAGDLDLALVFLDYCQALAFFFFSKMIGVLQGWGVGAL